MEIVYIKNLPPGNKNYTTLYQPRLTIEERTDLKIHFDMMNNCISCNTG